MYEEVLKQIGLTENEAHLYEALLEIGSSSVNQLLKKVPLKRGTIYNVLYSLIDRGLVAQEKKKKKTLFETLPPNKLEDFITRKQEGLVQARKNLANILSRLKSQYILTTEKPVVRFFEGEVGLEKIYDDILNVGKDFLLVRASFEPVYEKEIIPKIIDKFIKKRVKKGIKVQAITTRHPRARPELDKTRLFTRQWVKEKFYNAPVEINIYGDKVALLSFGKELIGTIIESKQITKSFRQIFHLARLGVQKTEEEKK